MAEFLPLCDLLFNVVSLAAYFCDLVFDLLVVYALYRQGLTMLCIQCACAVICTMLITQGLSLRWYLLKKPPDITVRVIVIGMHVVQMGVLWRYARLLMPVKISTVKKEVRDLCILRLVHGFVQAAPMLLLQLNLLADQNEHGVPTDLVTVSASLSLFSICWSLASFSKHVQSVERLVLTWLGVMSQLFWRAGTVTSRVLALSAYAATHHVWVLLVLALHWFCMFLWLLSPRSPFHGQRGKNLGVCALVAAIYILAYINLHGKPHGRTMTIFYIVMLLENSLLVGVWTAAKYHYYPHWHWLPILTITLFIVGLLFMLLYYRFFHVRRLIEKPAVPSGVFNCRFGAYGGPNSALYRKKKKPTTFVPPPNVMPVPFWRRPLPSSSENEGSSVGSRVNIHQKLQEKKQKQLAELKIIEEEIKQGKLVGPENADFDDRQPIPRTKKHVEPQLLSLASLNNLASYGVNLNRRPPPRAPRNRTPELLLTPRYLYCDCVGGVGGGMGVTPPEPVEESRGNGAQHHSDLESQVSLPRSYTLPREFKYYRRQRLGRAMQPVASTNSSDGDVDSADDESDSNPPPPALVRPLRRPYRHETQL